MRVRRDPRGWPRRAALLLLIGPAVLVAGRSRPHAPTARAWASPSRRSRPTAGLTAVTVFGGKDANRYLLETTGTGVALFDFDGDGRLDVFLVNGTTLEGFPKGQEPVNHLYRNRGDGTFEDVTARSGLGRERLGPGRVRGRLRQRRARGPLRHVLRPEPAVSATAATARSRTSPRRRGPARQAHALGHGLRVPRLRPRRQARPPRRQLHRHRPRHRAHARLRPVPLQGRQGRLRSARPHRRQERALPQSRGRHVRGRLRQGRHHAGQRHLRPRREHARLRRRRLGGRLRRQRLQPERALPQQPRRHVHRRRRDLGLRVQPGRQAAGGHGRGHRRLRSQRHHGHLQDELRGRHLDPVREHRPGILRRPHVRRPASASTRAGWAGAPRSSTSTTTAGSTSSSPTATSTPRWRSSRPRRPTRSARSSTAIAATAGSRT